MEELLNKLIKKGWRIENPKARISDVKYMYGLRELRIVYETDRRDAVRAYPIRFLVSKESGLWQFVCKNEMIKSETGVGVNAVDGMYKEILINQYDYRYRLIESALKDKSELEDFLLRNIKVEGVKTV